MEVGTEKKENEAKLNAKLFVRILPTSDFSYNSIKLESNKKVLYIRCLQDSLKKVKPKNQNYWCFCTDGVFWNSSQAEIYETVTADLFEEIFKGSRALILCYGQTGSGKTFTTSGLRFHYQNRGLILRILSRLFEEEGLQRDVTKIRFGISYVEFLGENVKDLIMNKKVPDIKKCPEYPMTNEAWAWKQIFEAETRKSYSEKAPYEGSNRGHSVLTFYMHAESLIDTDPVIRHSKIHIVDMSGFGNFGSKTSFWRNKLDLGNSNLSKSFLEQFLLCLTKSSSRTPFCPPTSSRFLMHLSDTLKPHCLIRFVAHIVGNYQNIRLTISTLKFGEKVRNFPVKKLERVSEMSVLQIKNLEKECIELRKEIQLTGMLLDSPDFCGISQQRVQEIQRAVEGFLSGQLQDLTLLNLGQATFTLKIFRDLYNKLLAEKEQAAKQAIANAKEPWERHSSLGSRINTSSSQKVLRNKSRHQDSQSVGAPLRVQESSQTMSRTFLMAQQVGTTDKKGIGIGPGKTWTNYEGNITKAFQKLRSRKSDGTIVTKRITSSTREVGVAESKNQTLDQVTDFPAEIPSRDEAWRHFLEEKNDVISVLRSEIKTYEEGGLVAQKNYVETLNEVAKLQEEIEECKSELKNLEHIRQIFGTEKFDDEGNLIPDETEKNLMKVLAQTEKQINVAVENSHVALVDFTNTVEKLNDAKKSLEMAFQDFSKEHYKVSFLMGEVNFASTDLNSKEPSKETLLEFDLNSQAQMVLFLHLQEKLYTFVCAGFKPQVIFLQIKFTLNN